MSLFYSKVNHLYVCVCVCIYIYMYVSPLGGFPSQSGYHRALNKVPCIIQEVLISDLFYA